MAAGLCRVGFSWISGLDALLGGGSELNLLLEGEVSLFPKSKCHKRGILLRASCSRLGFPSPLFCSKGNPELPFPGFGIALTQPYCQELSNITDPPFCVCVCERENRFPSSHTHRIHGRGEWEAEQWEEEEDGDKGWG